MAVDLLQQLGLNKYEAEAYCALLRGGALTGYEVGKRSQVPLSRSYEVLERLARKGLALVQPGDPPRYSAERPERVVARMRRSAETTLDALDTLLGEISVHDAGGAFLVVRGRENVLTRSREMIAGAETAVGAHLPEEVGSHVTEALHMAEVRGCRILTPAPGRALPPSALVVVVDDREVLAGTLQRGDDAQAIISTDAALVALARHYFSTQEAFDRPSLVISRGDSREGDDWVAWETNKQRRLWRLTSKPDVA